MKKRLLAFVLAIALAAGCASSVAVPQMTVEAATKKPSIKNFRKEIKKALGNDINLNVSLDKDAIKERYGVPSSWYSGASAEVCMLSANVDTLVIIKAKNSSYKTKIKNKLTAYRKSLINESVQYPTNRLKVQASRVYTKGNYVCFIMLGTVDSKLEESGTDEQIIKAFKDKNQKAVDAIKSFYK